MKKRAKRAINIFLALFIACLLASCGTDDQTPASLESQLAAERQ